VGSSQGLEVTDQRIAGRPTSRRPQPHREASTFTSEDVIGKIEYFDFAVERQGDDPDNGSHWHLPVG